MTDRPFGPREVDALQELASIGCGQAITALGKLAQRRFDMDVPEAWVGRTADAVAGADAIHALLDSSYGFIVYNVSAATQSGKRL